MHCRLAALNMGTVAVNLGSCPISFAVIVDSKTTMKAGSSHFKCGLLQLTAVSHNELFAGSCEIFQKINLIPDHQYFTFPAGNKTILHDNFLEAFYFSVFYAACRARRCSLREKCSVTELDARCRKLSVLFCFSGRAGRY